MTDFSQMTFPQQIASSIEWRITSGKYRVGERIPTESQLATSFGVSRGTVREALKSLVSIGMLESHQGSGTFVKAGERLQATVCSALSSSSPEDIVKTRILLERDIAAAAAEERDEEDLRKLRESLNGIRESNGSDEMTGSIEDFLMSLAGSTHNRLLHSLYRFIASYNPAETVSTSISPETSGLFAILYDAVEHHDGDMARMVMSRISNCINTVPNSI